MHFTTILTTLLSANVALGARFTSKRREAREARRAAARVPRTDDLHAPHPVMADAPDAAGGNESIATFNSHNSYTQNWAGAALVSNGVTSVTGMITVPTPSAPQDGKQYGGAAWVGIDGATCTSAILQTGIDWYVQNGQVTYDAWYEWFPDYSYDFTNFPVKAGDVVRFTVGATSTTSGAALIENLTTGQRATQSFANVANGALCETNAEWIVEDFASCDQNGQNCGLVPFANFGAVTFTNSFAMEAGTAVTPGTAPASQLMVLDIYQNSKILTKTTVSSGTVGVVYQN